MVSTLRRCAGVRSTSQALCSGTTSLLASARRLWQACISSCLTLIWQQHSKRCLPLLLSNQKISTPTSPLECSAHSTLPPFSIMHASLNQLTVILIPPLPRVRFPSPQTHTSTTTKASSHPCTLPKECRWFQKAYPPPIPLLVALLSTGAGFWRSNQVKGLAHNTY